MNNSNRHHFEIRVSGAVALLSVWLTAVALPACENVESTSSGKACAVACGEQNPDGRAKFNSLNGLCACDSCSTADCRQSVCREGQPPSDACLPCVQESLRSDCRYHSGMFEAACGGSGSDCRTFVLCLDACDSGGTVKSPPL
jgi:hypothetical protein